MCRKLIWSDANGLCRECYEGNPHKPLIGSIQIYRYLEKGVTDFDVMYKDQGIENYRFVKKLKCRICEEKKELKNFIRKNVMDRTKIGVHQTTVVHVCIDCRSHIRKIRILKNKLKKKILNHEK